MARDHLAARRPVVMVNGLVKRNGGTYRWSYLLSCGSSRTWWPIQVVYTYRYVFAALGAQIYVRIQWLSDSYVFARICVLAIESIMEGTSWKSRSLPLSCTLSALISLHLSTEKLLSWVLPEFCKETFRFRYSRSVID